MNALGRAWVLLLLGGALQVVWAIGLDYSDSFRNIPWDAVCVAALFASMYCMSKPMELGIAFSTAYAVWIGLGVVGTIAVSIAMGLETVNVLTVLFLALVVGGVVGLKATPVEYRGDPGR